MIIYSYRMAIEAAQDDIDTGYISCTFHYMLQRGK